MALPGKKIKTVDVPAPTESPTIPEFDPDRPTENPETEPTPVPEREPEKVPA